MARVRFKLNQAGVGKLMTGSGAQSEIMGRANRVAAAAGEGHDVRNATTDRARAIIMTVTQQAMEAEATRHSLTSAINAGRGG